MNTQINIKGLNKGAVLAALYNASRPQGMGFLQYQKEAMTAAEGETLLQGERPYFDYLRGRVMKIEIAGDEIDTYLYDRDNGPGAGEAAIQALRESGSEVGGGIQERHEAGKHMVAASLRGKLTEESKHEVKDGVAVVSLGLSDVAHVLAPAIEKATERP